MAIEYHQKAIQLSPKFGHAYNHMGITYYEIKDYKNAIHYYSKALEVNYDPKTSYFNLGLAYNRHKEYDQAVSSLLKALDLKYDPEPCYFELGLAYYELRQYEDGIKAFNELAKTHPDSAEIHFYLGQGHKALGRLYQARTEYKRALDSGWSDRRSDLIRAIKEIDEIAPHYKYIGLMLHILIAILVVGMPVGYLLLLRNQRPVYKPDKQKIFIFVFCMLSLPLPVYMMTTIALVPSVLSLIVGLNAASSTSGWERILEYALSFLNYSALIILNYFFVCMLHKKIRRQEVTWIIGGILIAASLFEIYWIQGAGGTHDRVNALRLYEKMLIPFATNQEGQVESGKVREELSKKTVPLSFTYNCFKPKKSDATCLLGVVDSGKRVILLHKDKSIVCTARTGKRNDYEDVSGPISFTEIDDMANCEEPENYSVAVVNYDVTSYEVIPLQEFTDQAKIKEFDQIVRNTDVLQSLLDKDAGAGYRVSEDISGDLPRVFRCPIKNTDAYILEYMFVWGGASPPVGPRVMVLNGSVYGLTGQCSHPGLRMFRMNGDYYIESGSSCCECGITGQELFRIDRSGPVRVHSDYSFSD
jgi:tetratricopeptide (TPR) repeat protein